MPKPTLAGPPGNPEGLMYQKPEEKEKGTNWKGPQKAPLVKVCGQFGWKNGFQPYDIGFPMFDGAIERGHDMVYICLDNENYANTGGQRTLQLLLVLTLQQPKLEE